MTANHAHTPTPEHVRFIYSLDGADREYKAQEFDRWYNAELAAAEQRGAARALREAAQVMQDDLAWVNTQRGLLVFEHESDPGISPFQWLENRADQMEGDDD